jgi:hypothetical protein
VVTTGAGGSSSRAGIVVDARLNSGHSELSTLTRTASDINKLLLRINSNLRPSHRFFELESLPLRAIALTDAGIKRIVVEFDAIEFDQTTIA